LAAEVCHRYQPAMTQPPDGGHRNLTATVLQLTLVLLWRIASERECVMRAKMVIAEQDYPQFKKIISDLPASLDAFMAQEDARAENSPIKSFDVAVRLAAFKAVVEAELPDCAGDLKRRDLEWFAHGELVGKRASPQFRKVHS
jgi:hypothetical protein